MSSPADIAERMRRRMRQRKLASAGYSINRPKPGEALFDYWGPNGRLTSIRVAADGTLSRYREPKESNTTTN